MPPRPLSVDDLDAEQRRLLADLTRGPRAQFLASHEAAAGSWALPGPFGPMLLAPAVGGPLQALGAAIRYQGVLPEEVRELAIVAVAAACRSSYELDHHLPLARAAGVGDDVLTAAAGGDEIPDRLLGAVAGVSRALAVSGRADAALVDVVETELGPAAAFELVVLAGYYRLLATVLAAYAIG